MVENPENFVLLHVEDNELDARALRRALQQLGFNAPIHWARDGVEALEMLQDTNLRTSPPQQTVVLLDLNMPRMNGIEFLNELRKDEELRQMPVFVLTTSNRPVDIKDAYTHNVAGYIVKPVGSKPYVENINRLNEFLSIIELPKLH